MSNNFLDGEGDSRIMLTAILNFADDPWNLYASGYLEAANALVQGLVQGTIREGKTDLLVYPITYLYRHHLELRIKQLYVKTCRFLGVNAELKQTHPLLDNWQDFKQKLDLVAEKFSLTRDTRHYLNLVEKKLRTFSEIDNTSMTFRYPIDRQGNNHLSDRKSIHLGQLAEFVTDLAEDLENINLQLSYLFDVQDRFSEPNFINLDGE
jgi:hypothetical protein